MNKRIIISSAAALLTSGPLRTRRAGSPDPEPADGRLALRVRPVGDGSIGASSALVFSWTRADAYRWSGFGPVAVTRRCGTQSSTWEKPSKRAPWRTTPSYSERR
jgi:hypothetical protein